MLDQERRLHRGSGCSCRLYIKFINSMKIVLKNIHKNLHLRRIKLLLISRCDWQRFWSSKKLFQSSFCVYTVNIFYLLYTFNFLISKIFKCKNIDIIFSLRLDKPVFALKTLAKGLEKCCKEQQQDVQQELEQLRNGFKELQNLEVDSWQGRQFNIKDLGKHF